MNSIEMTDVDGDALTIITCGSAAWITSTSGRDEVTVGPFPPRLVKSAILQGATLQEAFTQGATASGADDSASSERPTTATLIASAAEQAPAPAAPTATADARERAWAAFRHASESLPLRDALDAALDAALVPATRPSAAEELAEDLRQVSITAESADALADHLLTLGYRKTS